ncbi:reverse transcriptase domain-containing protein [Tanacetum coccineum]
MKFASRKDDTSLSIDMVDLTIVDHAQEILPSDPLDSFLFEPIINYQQAPDWNLDFQQMCDASDYAIGAVLGQRIDKKFRPIYYASKTMNDTQEHYATTKKELLIVVYAFDKFRSYLIMSKTIIYTDHSALKYLFSKQDAKPRLIRWVLLLQEFTIEIKDKKGTKNLAANHLSRLENSELEKLNEEAIRDSFPDEHIWLSMLGNMNLIHEDVCSKESYKEFLSIVIWGRPEDIMVPTLLLERTAYKSPIGSTPFRTVYGKACHLPIEIEHKAYWALRNVNLDLDAAGKHRFLQLNELAKSRNKAYEHSRAYKERAKCWHKEFHEGEEVFPYGTIEVCGKNGVSFKVNGHTLKKYYGGDIHAIDEDLHFARTQSQLESN